MKRTWMPTRRVWLHGVVAAGLALLAAPAWAACPEVKFGGPATSTEPDFDPVTGGGWAPHAVTVNGQPSSPKPNQGGSYQWTQVSGPSVTLLNATTPKVDFVAPDVPAAGATVVVRLTVSGCGGSASDTYTVNITDAHDIVVNAPPHAVATATPPSAHEGDLVALDGASSWDSDNDPLTYHWQQIEGPSVVLANANQAQTSFLTPNVAATATLKFRLTVSDGSLQNATEVTFNALWTNDAPVARLTCPSDVNEGASVTLNGSASTDADDGIASYEWKQEVGLPVVPGVITWNTPTVTFDAPSLGFQQSGLVPFTLTVKDGEGAASSTTCYVFIHDVTAPVIAGAQDLFAEATSSSGADVAYPLTAFDAVDGDLTSLLGCTPPAGPFSFGETSVSCSVTDSASNLASAAFSVTVADTTAPVIHANAEVAVEAEGPDGAIVTFEATTTDAVDGNGFATCTPSSGSLFPVGDSSVTCSAQDSHGNDATPVGITVRVMDTTAPALTLPTLAPVEATSPAGGVATFDVSATDIVDGSVPVSCDRVSGETFALGISTVSCTAVDAHGNLASGSFAITVQDTTAPSLTNVPGDITAEATSAAGASVAYVEPIAIDIVDGPVGVICTPVSGSTFPLGTTQVHCNATDSRGNSGGVTFGVTVEDTTPPALTNVPADFTAEATSAAGATVSYVLPTATDLVDGDVAVSCAPASGTVFGFGATMVTCSATDARGNPGSASFTVTVDDTTPPAIGNVPANQTVEATSAAGAVATYALPTASDVVDGDVAVSCAPASGSTFALGYTTVNCTAIDAHGNDASAAFSVQVVDTTAPAIVPPANVQAEATGPLTAVSHGSATATDAVGVVSLTNNAPTQFPLGTTTITWIATDAAGNSASATSTVTVVDTTAPAVTVPANMVREATSSAGASATFAASALDLVYGNVAVSCSPPSGSTFPLGITTVTCSATDGSGNTGSASFTVQVRDTTAPHISYLGDVTVIAGSGSSAVVNYTQPTAWDIVDGDVAVDCSPVSGSTFQAGQTTVECSATDEAGNTASGTFTVKVNYAWTGFFQPIDTGMNSVKAGSAIPVKFSLGGNQGMNIFLSGPVSGQIACTATDGDPIEETVTAGNSSLQYDPGSNQYIYVWKTEKSWAGQCRILQVKLRDGSVKSALFKFK